MGESAGACICLGVAQELIKRKEEKLASMIFISWPMIGDKLCGEPTSDWTSYETAFRDQDKFYEAMSMDLDKQRDDPYIYPIKMHDSVLKRLPKTVIITSEFDCYRSDSSKMAARLFKFGKLAEFVVHPGLNHGSPLLVPSESA